MVSYLIIWAEIPQNPIKHFFYIYICISILQTQSTEQHIHKCLWDTHQHQCKEAKQGEQWGEMMSHAKTHTQATWDKTFRPWCESECIVGRLTYVAVRAMSEMILTLFCFFIIMIGFTHSGHCVALDHLKRDWCTHYNWIQIPLNLLMAIQILFMFGTTIFFSQPRAKPQVTTQMTQICWPTNTVGSDPKQTYTLLRKGLIASLTGRRERKGGWLVWVHGDGSGEEWRVLLRLFLFMWQSLETPTPHPSSQPILCSRGLKLYDSLTSLPLLCPATCSCLSAAVCVYNFTQCSYAYISSGLASSSATVICH